MLKILCKFNSLAISRYQNQPKKIILDSTLGNSLTFFIFGMIALIGFFIMIKVVPETRGKSLEELEEEFVTS